MEKKASFRFDYYRFRKAELNFDNIKDDDSDYELAFTPSGVFNSENSEYKLTIEFSAVLSSGEKIVSVLVDALFVFNEQISVDDIPVFFYPNSIAIVFPYIRSFVSTLTLQANMYPMVLPTMNLTGLQEELRRNTTVE